MSPGAAPAPAAAPPDIELLDGDGLEDIRTEWADLWHSCGTATPFQSPEWLLPWTRHYAPGRSGAAALRRCGRLEGLVPVFTWRGSLLLAGTGVSDHGDGLFAPGAGKAAGRLLAALPRLGCGAFDRIDLRQLCPGSPLLAAPPPSGWEDRRERDESCLAAPLVGEDGLGAASKKCRSNWRYAMRRIGREGGEVDLVPPEEAAGGMEGLIRLHALRWRARGESGVLADARLQRFLTEAACELARAGLLRLHRLRFGSDSVAALLVLAGREAHFYYIGGFDPEYGRLGPSGALVGAAMAQARSEGADKFDMLRGSERYKLRWGAEERATWRRVLTRR